MLDATGLHVPHEILQLQLQNGVGLMAGMQLGDSLQSYFTPSRRLPGR